MNIQMEIETLDDFFEFFLKLLNYLFDFLDMVKLVYIVLGIFISKAGLKLKTKYQKHMITKILSLNTEKCNISAGICEATWFESKNEMTLLSDVRQCQKVMKFLSGVNVNCQLYGENNNNDEILIGGPASNLRTNFYLSTSFPDFKIHLKKSLYKYNKYFQKRIESKVFVYDNEFYGVMCKDKKLEFIPEIKDYAFIIKLTHEDFPLLSAHKTVHMFFGNSIIATDKAIDFFIKHYKKIYKKFRDRHYFIGIEIDKKLNDFIVSKSYIDLTDKMFKKL